MTIKKFSFFNFSYSLDEENQLSKEILQFLHLSLYLIIIYN